MKIAIFKRRLIYFLLFIGTMPILVWFLFWKPAQPKIYKVGFKQVWSANWNDSTYDEIQLIVEGLLWVPQQLRMVYIYPTLLDSVTLDSVKYPRTELTITGVRENDSEIWIHPPRQAYYEITEQASFPYVKFPIHVGQKYTHRRDIPKGNYENVNLDGDSVLHFYEVKDFKLKRNGGFTDSTWLIKSYGISRNGKAIHDFLFHPRLGFVYSHYEFTDGDTLNLKLKSYTYLDSVSNYSVPNDFCIFF